MTSKLRKEGKAGHGCTVSSVSKSDLPLACQGFKPGLEQLYAVPLTFLLIVLKLVVIRQSDSQYIGVNGAKQQSNYLHLLIDKIQYFSLD